MKNADRVRQFARAAYDRDEPTGWFEDVYAHANGSADCVPWAEQAANPQLKEWIEKQDTIDLIGARSLVIGCGLGDDAELLATLGSRTTAFDISDTAVRWCRERFANSSVDYRVADLFAPPAEWRAGFDFVFEAFTLQALPWKLRAQAMKQIATFVAPAGELLVITRGRDAEEEAGTLPWPLTKEELDAFCVSGLQLAGFEDLAECSETRLFRAWFSLTI